MRKTPHALIVGSLLLAACQPQASRLLLLDLALTDPVLLESTAAPWDAAGYRVEYRRFYPHLTRDDLARYRTVIVLGGREPEVRSDALAIGDLAILTEWVGRGGVVVLGYATDQEDGSGALDRWTMNRWLAALGAGVAIGPERLEDTTRGARADPDAVPQPRSALDQAGFAAFPAGRNHRILIRDPSQALARPTAAASHREAAVVATSRVQDGLVVVVSRNALAAAPADARTHDFFEALARWTRRPAEWASVSPAGRPGALLLANAPAPRPMAVHPPPLTFPPGAEPLQLPLPRRAEATDATPAVPRWISRQGMRGLWTPFTPQSPYALERLVQSLDIAALNAFVTLIPPAALGDTLGARNPWRVTVERLETTSLRWFPAVDPAAIPSVGMDEVDLHGELVPVSCGLDSDFWREAFRPTLRALARLGGASAELHGGVGIDLDGVARRYGAAGFCDADYREGLADLGLAPADRERLAALPPTARYDTLLERGLLARYYATLEAAVAERAVALRAELRRLRPDLRFVLRASGTPADWFSLGLLRGLSDRDAPVLLWTSDQPGARGIRRRYRERGIMAIAAVGLEPERVPAGGWSRLPALAFGAYDGFWLSRVPGDSVGRLVRRLAK